MPLRFRIFLFAALFCIPLLAQKGSLHIDLSYVSEWVVSGSQSNPLTDPLFNNKGRLSGMGIDLFYSITERSGAYIYASGSMASEYKFEIDGFEQAIQTAYPEGFVSIVDGYRNRPFKLAIIVGGYRRRLGQNAWRPEVSIGMGMGKWRLYKGIANIKMPDSQRLYNLICDLEEDQINKTHLVGQLGFSCRPVLYKRLYARLGLQCQAIFPASVTYQLIRWDQLSGEYLEENVNYQNPIVTLALSAGLGIRL